ncbi:MAG TPA: hypothetical protein VD999_02905 [Vitreimonas sp.]|nr:hypothetical protein [Vitreimonas sp.]
MPANLPTPAPIRDVDLTATLSKSMSFDDPLAVLQRVQKEIETVKGVMEVTDQKQYDWLELSKKTFEFASYARYWFAKGDVKTKTQILQLLGQNLKLYNKKVVVDHDNPFWMIEKAKAEVGTVQVSIEPTKMAGASDLNVYLQPAIPRLLRVWESDPACEIMSLTCTVH